MSGTTGDTGSGVDTARGDASTRIVVGVDTSAGSRGALRWAADEAARRGWSLTAILAWSYLDQPHKDEQGRFEAGYSEADALANLAAVLDETLGPEQAATVERRAICDHPAQALVEASADAAMLVIGARGLGRFRSMVLGSVSNACLHHAACPVVVVRDVAERGAHEGAPDRIIAAVDGSPGSRRALAWAVEAARARQAHLDVVHVWATPVYPAHPLVPATFDVADFEASARAVIEDTLGSVDTRGLPSPPEVIPVQGTAAASILDVAKGADLIVVGSRGRGGFSGLLLGSVSSQVAHHATCPVAVVPPDHHHA